MVLVIRITRHRPTPAIERAPLEQMSPPALAPGSLGAVSVMLAEFVSAQSRSKVTLAFALPASRRHDTTPSTAANLRIIFLLNLPRVVKSKANLENQSGHSNRSRPGFVIPDGPTALPSWLASAMKSGTPTLLSRTPTVPDASAQSAKHV